MRKYLRILKQPNIAIERHGDNMKNISIENIYTSILEEAQKMLNFGDRIVVTKTQDGVMLEHFDGEDKIYEEYWVDE